MGLKDLAFGPGGAFFAIPREEAFVCFWEFIPFRKCEERTLSAVGFSCPSGHVFGYEDGSTGMMLHPDLEKLIDAHGLRWISFGPEGSYIFMSAEGAPFWWNIPPDLVKQVKTQRLLWATLGRSGAFVAMWDDADRTYSWSGVPAVLNEILSARRIVHSREKIATIERVWLSAFDDRFYVEYDGGAGTWEGCSDYFHTMMLCDRMLSPGEIEYTSDSISAAFADGRSIFDTGRDLNSGAVSVTDLPMISVCRIDGVYCSLNNRRLWCFKNSGVDLVPVEVAVEVATPQAPGGKASYREIRVRYNA